MKNKRIGILTFWGVPNHGCFLQAYSLQKVISNMFPEAEVKQLQYLNCKHYRYYYRINFTAKNIRNLYRVIREKKELREYLSYYDGIPHYENKLFSIPNIELDCLVLGSDIIWDTSSPLVAGDRALFGQNISARKKIAYSPSCGRVSNVNQFPNYAINGIKNLDDISVRDENTKKIINEVLNKEVSLTLDPTLLYDFSSDSNIIDPMENEPFVVVYGNDFDLDIIECVKRDKRKKVNLEFLEKDYSWCDSTIRRNALSPLEWVGYFKNCEYVVTSTFHGLIFGIMFNKKILFQPTPFIMAKAEKLINELGLEGYLLNDIEKSSLLGMKWDYEKVNSILQIKRKESEAYLFNAIGRDS